MTNMKYNKTTKTLTITRSTMVNISVALLIFLGGALITATIQVQNVRNQVDNNAGSIGKLQERIGGLESDSVTTKVQLSDIQAQLRGIDANLLEIKQRLE